MLGTPAPKGANSLLAGLSRLKQSMLDLLYPPRCAGCGRVGVLFCEACHAQVVSAPAPACLRCGRPHVGDTLCPVCRRQPSSLSAIHATAVFAGPLRAAIHDFKYRQVRDLASPLAARLANCWQDHGLTADYIVPVPLHETRQEERGYNQAALLARTLSHAVAVPYSGDLMVRSRATPPQVNLGAAERRANVSGAFLATRSLDGQRIALIDDVCTTGATLEACASALREAGVAEVWALVVARARWDPDRTAPELG